MSDKEPKAWITVNGNHIPIFEGESKGDAVKRWTKEKTKKQVGGKTVYHGTDRGDIESFESKGRESNGAIFFSESEDYAESMAEEKDSKSKSGKYIYEVKLDMKNPMVVKMSPNEFGDPVKEKKYIELAKSKGHDSISFVNDTDDELLKDTFHAVFSPKQIHKVGRRKL